MSKVALVTHRLKIEANYVSELTPDNGVFLATAIHNSCIQILHLPSMSKRLMRLWISIQLNNKEISETPISRYYSKWTHELSAAFSEPEAMNLATSAQQASLSASSSGISMENSCSTAITSSTLSKLSRDKSFWKSAVSVTWLISY